MFLSDRPHLGHPFVDVARATLLLRTAMHDAQILLTRPSVDLITQLRRNPVTANATLIALADGDHARALLQAGVDEVLPSTLDDADLTLRLDAARIRDRRLRDVHPLTGLPGGAALQRHLSLAIEAQEQFCAVYADLARFKAFNDTYGLSRGDTCIHLVGQILLDGLCHLNGVCYHVGGDDFIAVVPTSDQRMIAPPLRALGSRFDTAVRELYDPEDRARGYVVIADSRMTGHHEPVPIPLTSLVIAAVSPAWSPMRTADDVTAAAARQKEVLKSTVPLVSVIGFAGRAYAQRTPQLRERELVAGDSICQLVSS